MLTCSFFFCSFMRMLQCLHCNTDWAFDTINRLQICEQTDLWTFFFSHKVTLNTEVCKCEIIDIFQEDFPDMAVHLNSLGFLLLFSSLMFPEVVVVSYWKCQPDSLYNMNPFVKKKRDSWRVFSDISCYINVLPMGPRGKKTKPYKLCETLLCLAFLSCWQGGDTAPHRQVCLLFFSL